MLLMTMMLMSSPNGADDCSICSGLIFFLTLRLDEDGASGGGAIAVPAVVNGVIAKTVFLDP